MRNPNMQFILNARNVPHNISQKLYQPTAYAKYAMTHRKQKRYTVNKKFQFFFFWFDCIIIVLILQCQWLDV